MHMEDKNKSTLLSMEFKILSNLANSSEFAQYTLNSCEKYITEWQKIKVAIVDFIDKKNGIRTENIIDNMTNLYKGLSREERFEFNKKIAQEGTFENSLDMLDYNWKHFLGTIQKAVKE